ncbi:PRC-barrel domain containing protein [Kitasatospora sp. NPDC001540]|uniref:PRC-barrel domain containing protein n=1 Tax=Kitasatospora sp. NPDC001540 TaxID=3364014 RepID=UPI0036BE89C4
MSDGMWGYENAEGYNPGVDLTGFRVEATDGHIGKVDKHSYEAEDGHIVVDTGPWIFGRTVMLPAGIIRLIDEGEKTVWVDRSKDEIKNAPEYHHETHATDRDYRRGVGGYYGTGL